MSLRKRAKRTGNRLNGRRRSPFPPDHTGDSGRSPFRPGAVDESTLGVAATEHLSIAPTTASKVDLPIEYIASELAA